MATGPTFEEAREKERFQTFLQWIRQDAPPEAREAIVEGARRRLPQIKKWLNENPEASPGMLKSVLERALRQLKPDAD